MQEKKKDILVVLGRSSTRKILEFLEEHADVRYKDLRQFAKPYALNRILRELMDFDLIKYYFVSEGVREEWYESTERGRKILQCLRELEEILKE